MSMEKYSKISYNFKRTIVIPLISIYYQIIPGKSWIAPVTLQYEINTSLAMSGYYVTFTHISGILGLLTDFI